MITLRLVDKKDDQFIYKVYRSSRENELKLTNWPETQKHAIITMQLTAQLTDYTIKFPGILYYIIVLKKKSVGRLYIWESSTEIKIVDITLLPEFQHKKIGTTILQQILNKAVDTQKKVSLHVFSNNPALKLYERLGFKKISIQQDRYYMEFNIIDNNKSKN